VIQPAAIDAGKPAADAKYYNADATVQHGCEQSYRRFAIFNSTVAIGSSTVSIKYSKVALLYRKFSIGHSSVA